MEKVQKCSSLHIYYKMSFEFIVLYRHTVVFDLNLNTDILPPQSFV